MSEPSVRIIEALERIEQRLDRLERSSETARTLCATAPGALATLVDTFDGLVARMSAAGIDVDQRINTLVRVAERLTAPEALEMLCEVLDNVELFDRLRESGVFGPGAVNIVGRAADALGRIDIDQVEPVGALGAFKALRHPDMKQALGVLMAFGKYFGESTQRTYPRES